MIVIPMAGLSRRFAEAGYTVPKYRLEAHGKTLFAWSVESFRNLYAREAFLFVGLKTADLPAFLDDEVAKLGIRDWSLVELDAPTRGQAETVFEGLRRASVTPETSITIFNIDTFRPNFAYPARFDLGSIDGYLECFRGSGMNWSNVEPEAPDSDRVKRTSEKEGASELCCTGLYHWSRSIDFCDVYEIAAGTWSEGAPELYVAPLYNNLIRKGGDVRYTVIDGRDVIFCGVPQEYEEFLMRPDPSGLFARP